MLFVVFNSFGLGLRLPIGKVLAQALAHWKIAVGVFAINFVIIPLLFIGYLLTIASSIPDEVKVGFCVAALCAGMPFAPILARIAKADVGIATTLLVVLTVGTIIALPLGLPLAVDAVDAQITPSAWDVAWPLLVFLVLPLVLGCGFRVGWPDLTPEWAKWSTLVDPLSPVQCQLHAVCVLGPVRADVGARATSQPSPAPSSASGVATFSFPSFESKTWASGTQPRRPRRYATSLRCS